MMHLKELPEYAKFMACIAKHNLIPEGTPVVAAVSGGADSIAMLCLLYAYLAPEQITVVHVNHGIRGAEAKRDAEYVQAICAQLQLSCRLIEVDIPQIAQSRGLGWEECARIERYGFLRSIAQERNSLIAVAHHREDRAETVLMNIARGTGVDGLKGISYKYDCIIRPLLDFSKEEILRVCAVAGVVPVEDSTNLEDDTLRNRVRHHVIPYLSASFQRDIVDKILELSDLAGVDCEFLDSYTQEVSNRIVTQEESSWIMDRTAFLNEKEAIQNRLLRKIIPKICDWKGAALFPEGKDLTANRIMRVRNHIREGKSGKVVEVGRKIHCRIEGNRCVLYYCTEKDIDSEVRYPCITVYPADDMDVTAFLKSKSESCEIFDYGQLCKQVHGNVKIELRQIEKGDVFSPFGMKGSMRLRKFLIDQKIPLSHREKIRIVAADKQVLWIPGIRRSNLYPVTRKTKEIIQINIETEDIYNGTKE